MTAENNMDHKNAGIFSEWLASVRRSLATGEAVKVECGDCRACCTSSYFVHIEPGDTPALSKIPRGLLFPAPGLDAGNYILGYDEHGHCPMFKSNSCSIYNDRPHTCRVFDCRILTATGIPELKEKELINRQADRWEFILESKDDHDTLAALKRAGRFIIENEKIFPPGFIPKNAVQKAALAVKVYEIFLEQDCSPVPADTDEQRHKLKDAVIDACRLF